MIANFSIAKMHCTIGAKGFRIRLYTRTAYCIPFQTLEPKVLKHFQCHRFHEVNLQFRKGNQNDFSEPLRIREEIVSIIEPLEIPENEELLNDIEEDRD
jgi:hypothetical protein